jgi:hypothetical protein
MHKTRHNRHMKRFTQTIAANVLISALIHHRKPRKLTLELPNVACVGKADYIVTGGNHLLALNQFKKTKIVTVNQMLSILLLE